MSLQTFRQKVRYYCQSAGFSFKALAKELSLHPSGLSHKLHQTNNAWLHPGEVKEIIKVLARWEAINQQSEVLELLQMLNFGPGFISAEEWSQSPLVRLETDQKSKTLSDLAGQSDEASSMSTQWQEPDYEAYFQTELASSNLPRLMTSLVGRESETNQLKELLRKNEVSLVTLTGPGGVGKTSLALHLAAALLEDFEQRVFFVSLAPLNDPTLVLAEIANTLGLKEERHRSLPQILQTFLQHKSILLVLDNFEHIPQAGSVVRALLQATHRLKIIVTSRAVLHLYGEHEYVVQSLALPDPAEMLSCTELAAYPAINLFIQRARLSKPTFNLTEINALTVSTICARLDGLPLAIELAAAYIKLLSPSELLVRLFGSLANPASPLEFLNARSYDLPLRHQSLRHTIEWSYQSLEPDEQGLFAHLAIFSGGWTLEAVEAIEGGKVMNTRLASLLDKSMIQLEEGADDKRRFGMLQTLREYGLERLRANNQFEATADQHALYFTQLAKTADSELVGPHQTKWLEILEMEHDNLRAALGWLLEGVNPARLELALSLTATLWRFWWTRGYLQEGRYWLEIALEKSAGLPVTSSGATRTKALNAAGNLAQLQGDYAQAGLLHLQSLRVQEQLADKWGISASLASLGVIAQHQGNYEEAIRLFEESLALRRELGHKHGIGVTLGNLGIVYQYQKDYHRATELYQESMRLKQELGDIQGLMMVLNNLGMVALYQEDYPAAARLFEQSLAYAKQINHKRSLAYVLTNLGMLALCLGKTEQAAELLDESLVLKRELNDQEALAWTLEGLAGVSKALGQPQQAIQIYRAAENMRAAMGTPMPPSHRQFVEKKLMTTNVPPTLPGNKSGS